MSQEERANKREITGLYNRVARQFDQVGPETFARFGRLLVQDAHLTAGMRVLDVCTGRGANLFPALHAVGPTGAVIGVDLAWQMVYQTARVPLAPQSKAAPVLSCMDAEQLAFADECFDALLCGFAIFFLDEHQAFPEWKRLLRPGGQVGISLSGRRDPRWDWYEALLTEYHHRYNIPLTSGGEGLHHPEAVAEALETYGFSAVTIVTHTLLVHYPDVETWWQTLWTHGSRYPLEHFSPDLLDQFKREVLAAASQRELTERRTLACIFGTK